MPTVKRFEDLIAWQKGRELSRSIYKLTKQRDFSRDFGLCDQLRRSSVSVPSNIAEGFERGGNREFIQFLSIAKGSAAEVRAQLYVALDIGYITQDDFYHAHRLATEVSNLLNGLMAYLAGSEMKGRKVVSSKFNVQS